MNSTNTSTFTDPWKRVKIQYVSLVCGLAVAGAIAIGLDGLPRTGSNAGSAAPSTRISFPVKPTAAFYLVGSEDEAAVLEFAREERGSEASSWDSIVIAHSDQELASFLQDVDAQVVDLRGKLGVPATGAHDGAGQPLVSSSLEEANNH